MQHTIKCGFPTSRLSDLIQNNFIRYFWDKTDIFQQHVDKTTLQEIKDGIISEEKVKLVLTKSQVVSHINNYLQGLENDFNSKKTKQCKHPEFNDIFLGIKNVKLYVEQLPSEKIFASLIQRNCNAQAVHTVKWLLPFTEVQQNNLNSLHQYLHYVHVLHIWGYKDIACIVKVPCDSILVGFTGEYRDVSYGPTDLHEIFHFNPTHSEQVNKKLLQQLIHSENLSFFYKNNRPVLQYKESINTANTNKSQMRLLCATTASSTAAAPLFAENEFFTKTSKYNIEGDKISHIGNAKYLYKSINWENIK